MKTTTVATAAIGCLLALTGCSGVADAATSDSSDDAHSSGDVLNVDATSDEYAAVADLSAITLDALDLPDFEPQTSGAVALDLSDPVATDGVTVDGTDVVISVGGSYLVSGEWNGRLVVAVDDEDITLVLDGVDITSGGTGALVIDSADEAHVYLANGTTSTLTDGAVAPGDDTVNAALFSAANLWIGGQGTLVVNGSVDGITSKDSLLIDSGTYEVTAGDDGIRGKDHLVILDGTVTVAAAGDALRSDNEEFLDDPASDAGTVWIDAGTVALESGSDGIDAYRQVTLVDADLTVAAADDGVHTEGVLTITGGSVTVTDSFEGLEGAVVEISGGDISVTASDDGLNVAGGPGVESQTGMGPGQGQIPGGEMAEGQALPPGGEMANGQPLPPGGGQTGARADGELTGDREQAPGAERPGGVPGPGETDGRTLLISGGTIVLSGDGDALDANADVTMTGGSIEITGPIGGGDAGVDVDGFLSIEGGMFVANGLTEQTLDVSASGQGLVVASLGATVPAGTELTMVDASGTTVVTYVVSKATASLVASSSQIDVGADYGIYADGELLTATTAA